MNNDKLDRISERVYNASFILTVILILGASIGTAIVRYLTGSEIILVPDNVFKFIKDVLYIFAVPISIKIIGDKLPLVVQALQAMRGIDSGLQSTGYSNQFGINSWANNNPMYSSSTTTSQINSANPDTYF